MGSGPAVASLAGLSWGWDGGTEGTGGSHHPVLTAILFQLIFLAGILHVKVFFFFFFSPPHLFPSGHQRSTTPCPGPRCQEPRRPPREPNDSHRGSLQPAQILRALSPWGWQRGFGQDGSPAPSLVMTPLCPTGANKKLQSFNFLL